MKPDTANSDVPSIVITGATGKTAESLARILPMELPHRLVFFTHRPLPEGQKSIYGHHDVVHLDILNRSALREHLLALRPSAIINTAAITNVDLCEVEKKVAWEVNVRLVEYLCRIAKSIDAHLVHYSTDYIFDGLGGPYAEDHLPNPQSYYGKTKLASENEIKATAHSAAIIRTNVVYGATHALKPDFVQWALGKFAAGEPFRVVDDQYSNPALLDDLALTTLEVIRRRLSGVFHVGSRDWMHRLEFTKTIASVFGADPEMVSAMSTAELQQKAPRPMRGGLQTAGTEAALGLSFATTRHGLITVRRQLQLMGHHDWKL